VRRNISQVDKVHQTTHCAETIISVHLPAGFCAHGSCLAVKWYGWN